MLGHLERSSEAKATLDRYLTLRPNLKTRDHYRRIFIPNSALADPIIEGLVKAGWEPEECIGWPSQCFQNGQPLN